MPADYYGVTDAALEQRVAELSDEQFDALVARTRPPRLDAKEAAALALRRKVRGTNVTDDDGTKAAAAKQRLDEIFNRKG